MHNPGISRDYKLEVRSFQVLKSEMQFIVIPSACKIKELLLREVSR